jgi:hypothetical protein
VGGLFTAPMVDAELDGAVPWLVTDYVPGLSLADAVFPDATDWSHGNRELVCVAFHPTSSAPTGTPISGSIKGSRR